MNFHAPSGEGYQRAKLVREGLEHTAPDFEPFVAEFTTEYGFAPLTVFMDATPSRIPAKFPPPLVVVLERSEQYQRFRTKDHGVRVGEQRRTAQLFLGSTAPDVLERELGVGVREVAVYFADFETVAKADAHLQVTEDELAEFVAMLDLGDQFWHITRLAGPPIVFVHTDAQAKALDSPRVQREWVDKYFPFARAHDMFGYLTPDEIVIPVDSKQTFDEKYRSNWYFYFK